MKAVKCPLCSGNGKIINKYYNSGINYKICYGCSGKGWVEVYD
jgi:DnaJ-class molecular chaperone